MAELDDINFIRKVKNGDINAFAYIVKRYEGMVFTIVNKIVNNTAEAEDIVQDIFIKTYQTVDKFKEESEFSTWLYRIAYNTTISQLRKRKYTFSSVEDNFEDFPDRDITERIDDISVEQKLEYLDIVLTKLSPDDALMITMFYMNNHSIHEISAITGNSVANVKVKLYRIRKFMNFEINKLIKQ